MTETSGETNNNPTFDEVELVIRELTGGEYIAVRRGKDEATYGFYFLEIEVRKLPDGTTDEIRNETTLYRYMREGKYPEGETSKTMIHAAYCVDGEAKGGQDVAKCIGGKLVIK